MEEKKLQDNRIRLTVSVSLIDESGPVTCLVDVSYTDICTDNIEPDR